MRIHLITPALPPALDGIGDHSARLATEMATAGHVVTLLSPLETNANASADPVAGVNVVPVFEPKVPRTAGALISRVAVDRPDWVLLQYNPFAYGRRGLNLVLPRAFTKMKKASPGTRLALFAHEEFVPVLDLKHAVMTTWQRWQFRQLGRASDVLFSSVEAWADANRRRFPGKLVVHVPVGSNVPRVAIGRDAARERLGIGPGVDVLGIFGTPHNSRPLGPIRNALAAAAAAGHKTMLLSIGPGGEILRQALPEIRVLAEGPLPADEVSRRLAAIDVYLGAFVDGVSTRRGSWLAALQHGLACVGTVGKNTDTVFRDAAAKKAIVLTPAADPHGFDGPVMELLADPARRAALGLAADALSDREFAWHHLARRVLDAFAAPPTGGAS